MLRELLEDQDGHLLANFDSDTPSLPKECEDNDEDVIYSPTEMEDFSPQILFDPAYMAI